MAQAAEVTAASPNESSLRHELEKCLEAGVVALDGPWTPFRLDLTLRGSGGTGVKGFADVAHGAVVIEYEPPRSFSGRSGANLRHAQKQAEEYSLWLSQEEGRSIADYVLVAWDGAHISFGRQQVDGSQWIALAPFNTDGAERLLRHLVSDGIPLVHPRLLAELAGPESELGRSFIPALFDAVVSSKQDSRSSKTYLLFAEWRRLFGQAADAQSERLQTFLERQSVAHNQVYVAEPSCYLFALNTYIAIVAKVVAALALKGLGEAIADPSVAPRERLWSLETGRLFESAGISNMLRGDFFSWYVDDASIGIFEQHLSRLIAMLSGVSYDVAKKDPRSTRDLFKGMYESFVPEALRHALGEYYTPDWLASHGLDVVGWSTSDGLLDPTCGSGTFLLEALRRRLCEPDAKTASVEELLHGLYGFDLNPLAVLAARASMTVFLAGRLDPCRPVQLPVYLADAINPAVQAGQFYEHRMQTEQGTFVFRLPASLVESRDLFAVFSRLRDLIDSDVSSESAIELLTEEFDLGDWTPECREAFASTVDTLATLRERQWDGLWCSIIAERFAAGAIKRVPFIVGNPPWVKWSHLPPEYSEFIKGDCLAMGVFSQDRWVGGIESDISTVIVYSAAEHWASETAEIGFFITGTVFRNESSQGFRRFHLERAEMELQVVSVEDFSRVDPFDGVSNHACFIHLRRGESSKYPVPYRVWDTPLASDGTRQRTFATPEAFVAASSVESLWAAPVPGTDAGPWLVGSLDDHSVWRHVFGANHRHYQARKGVTTDLNGVFFVTVHSLSHDTRLAFVTNNPELGRKRVPTLVEPVEVEANTLYPLLRGRGVAPFHATPDPDHELLLPQTTMHGNPDLPGLCPGTHRYLLRFKSFLENRGSYRRYQRGKPYWSLWNVGSYTFSEYKVAWREMPGGSFAAAYVGPDPRTGRPVVPDHKVYFVPVCTEEEAAYLTGVLNAPTIARAVSSYASQLSLGVSVVEYLEIPRFDKTQEQHRAVAGIAKDLTARGVTDEGLTLLNAQVLRLLGIHGRREGG